MSRYLDIEIGFGTIFTPNLELYPHMAKRQDVITGIGSEGKWFSAATIMDKAPGQERLSSSGTAGIEDIGKLSSKKWSFEQILRGLCNQRGDQGPLLPESLFLKNLILENTKPAVLITAEQRALAVDRFNRSL